ncbi:hypothetical protein L6452_35681 [Arctium lappa]|uniref:Uncharacterized protein n=1 Tax=Arctium lappa TaxID=4217 RepID=A0ACB8Y8M7_ARCLA|nr:hypothetical protein L6452_35681 [Arctium lappa]
MATRILFVPVSKSHPKTKPSPHRTRFSAVAASEFLHISRLQISRSLETIYEEETTTSGEGIEGLADVLTSASPLPSVSASFLLTKRLSCGQMQKHLSKNSDNFRCAYGSK